MSAQERTVLELGAMTLMGADRPLILLSRLMAVSLRASTPNPYNENYLKTKKDQLGHLL
jgi:GTP cyclohydrolase II